MRVLCVLIVIFQQLITAHEYNALRFGKDDKSYILIEQDFSPLTSALSLCSWVKQMKAGNGPNYWLSYGVNTNPSELGFDDNAFNYLFSDATSHTKPTRTIGKWHNMCLTWSLSTRTKRVYYDGEQIGRETTPSGRKLKVPGSLLLGHLHDKYGVENIKSGYYFGGELYDANIFSTELSAAEVKEMFTQGRCAKYSQTFGENIFLSWRDILLKDRPGSVTEVELDECDTDEEKESDDRADENSQTWDFLRGKNFYNKIISKELLSDMTARLELLAGFNNHSIDDALIGHLQKDHSIGNPGNGKEEESEEEETGEAADSLSLLDTENWEFLRHKMFNNKVVTEELLSEITARLDLLVEFTGHRCDDALIEHLENYHSD